MTAEAGPWRTDNFNPLRPRGRRPSAVAHWLLPPGYFNPLRPRGRRLRKTPDQFTYGNFNPLRPRGRRPPSIKSAQTEYVISTHSAREDGDWKYHIMRLDRSDFNPLRPRGRRPKPKVRTLVLRNFNPLRPRGRRHLMLSGPPHFLQFQPTPPARTETISIQRWNNLLIISTHSAREDGDYSKVHLYAQKMISTHSAREDGD